MTRKALVVGISTYTHLPRLNLDTFGNNAEAIAKKLQDDCSFEVKRLPDIKGTESEPIVVGKRTPVTKAELEQAIVELFKPQGNFPPTTTLLYFAGHGIRKIEGFPGGYLVTSDADFKQNWGLSLQELRTLLQDSNIAEQIIWLDSCYSGELFNLQEANPGKGNNGSCSFIAAATELAYENTPGDYGVFTQALLSGLNPANYPSTDIDHLSLSAFVEREIKKSRFPQTPVFSNFGTAIKLRGASQTNQPNNSSLSTKTPTICPYQGLEYFTESTHSYFFGRTQLTSQLLNQVRQSNFLAILGASGSGKSSLLRAGLLYELKQGLRLSGSEGWQYYLMQPGKNPLQNLALAFVDFSLTEQEREAQLKEVENRIDEGADAWRRWAKVIDNERVVLLIDQFEEVFTLCRDKSKREKFFKCLLEALAITDNKLCVIIAMRADFFGKCLEAEYSGLAKKIQANLFSITPITKQELKLAITEPAKKVKLNIEPELIAEILKDVQNAPGSLPLMQDTLRELWRKDVKQEQDNCLRLKTYIKLGRVAGTLQQRATKVYEDFYPEKQEIVRHIFLSLTQLGEGTEDTHRRVLKRDLVTSRYSTKLTLIDDVIKTLAEERLIVTRNQETINNELGQESVVDVAHEALIRNWDKLRTWLDENRDYLRQKRKLESAAQEWLKSEKKQDYLLQSARLAEAKAYFNNFAQLEMLDRVAAEFLQASQDLQDHLLQEEKQRRQQELDNLKALRKAAEYREKEQVKANKKLRQREWIIATFFATIILSVLYFYGQQEKETSNLVEKTTNLITNSIERDLQIHLQSAWQVNKRFSSLIRSNILDPNNEEKMKQYFIDTVTYTQTLNQDYLNERSFFWGDEKGKVIGVIYSTNDKSNPNRETGKTTVWMSITKEEYNEKNQSKDNKREKIEEQGCQQDISLDINNVVEIYDINESGNIDKESHTLILYDPRQRPWYKEAKITETKTTQKWSTIYPFCQSQDFGMSAIVPIYKEKEQFVGVLATDVKLSEISEKLREATLKLDIFQDSVIKDSVIKNLISKIMEILNFSQLTQTEFGIEAFVIDEKNNLAAFSSYKDNENKNNEPSSPNKEKWSGLKISDDNLRNLYKAAIEQATIEKINSNHTNNEQHLSIESNKKRYFLIKKALNKGLGLDWDILVIIPENQYTYNRYTIYVEVLIGVFLTCLGFVTVLLIIWFFWSNRWVTGSQINRNR